MRLKVILLDIVKRTLPDEYKVDWVMDYYRCSEYLAKKVIKTLEDGKNN
jgi:hypothetical protein